MEDHLTSHKCSSSRPEEKLLLFVVIQNPKWPPWTLIGRDIFNFSRTTAWTITKLATNVPSMVLKRCCYFSLWCEIKDSPHRLIGRDIFDFFARTTAWTITKLAIHVSFMVLKKYCYFPLQSEIQDGHHGSWLVETLCTPSQEPLYGR